MTLSAGAPESVLDALYTAFASASIVPPADGRVLFLRARDGGQLRALRRSGWVCEQSFKPFADALIRAGMQVLAPEPFDLESREANKTGADHSGADAIAMNQLARDPASPDQVRNPSSQHYALVLVLPPRQRDEARALFARAASHALPGGIVVASVANAEGARSSEADLARLVGATQSLSKHKCRVFWSAPLGANVDRALLAEWLALDAPQPIAKGRYLSRPGLFAWNRVDPASALLAAQLPTTLAGRVADLGAGYGYLSTEILRRCARVTAVDLYEAEARALWPARLNLQRALAERDAVVATDVVWHDVSCGLPKRYDVIVSNPPFHLGRADRPDLGRAFIEVAAKALVPGGRFWLVANRHLPYETTLSTHFATVRTVIVQDGFKVIEAGDPLTSSSSRSAA